MQKIMRPGLWMGVGAPLGLFAVLASDKSPNIGLTLAILSATLISGGVRLYLAQQER